MDSAGTTTTSLGPHLVDGGSAMKAGERAVSRLREWERCEATVIVDLVEFDGANIVGMLGYTSLTRYVAYETGVSNREAHRLARLARFCRNFPATGEALRSGRVTVPYLELLLVAAGGLPEEYGTDEDELLDLARDRDVATFERAILNWRHRAEHQASKDYPDRAFNNRGLTIQRSFDGSGHGKFDLDALAADILEQALETPPDPVNDLAGARSLRQRRADALLEMAQHSLNCSPAGRSCVGEEGEEGHGSMTSNAGPRATVDVVVDINSLEDGHSQTIASIRAELANGTPLPRALVEQLLCDGSYRRLLMDGPSVVLDYGTATRAISPALRRAIMIRDRHCQFKGCDRGGGWCDVHHLKPVSQGGATSERNLALVCRHHHTLIHHVGWHLGRDPTTGKIHTTSP